jgi:hypothetical protein
VEGSKGGLTANVDAVYQLVCDLLVDGFERLLGGLDGGFLVAGGGGEGGAGEGRGGGGGCQTPGHGGGS